MNAEPKQTRQLSPAGTSSFSLGLARVFWTVLGPLLLIGGLIQNAVSPKGWLTSWDAVVALTVAAMIACRWAEQRSGGATTAYGEPSTSEHFRRYVLLLIIAGGFAWVLVNVVGNHVLS